MQRAAPRACVVAQTVVIGISVVVRSETIGTDFEQYGMTTVALKFGAALCQRLIRNSPVTFARH